MHGLPNLVWKILKCVYANTPCTEKVHTYNHEIG